MALVVPQAGARRLLDKLIGASALTYHLYVGDVPPVILPGTVIGDFTEASYPGYAAQLSAGWGAAVDVAGRATATAANLTFTRGAGAGAAQNIYGYYVTDVGGNLVYAERGTAPPYVFAVTGDNLVVTPKFTFKSEF